MKIAAVSDIHVRTFGSDKPLIESIKKRVRDIAPDIFIIAGDISHDIEVLSDNLSLLAMPGVLNLFVPGNHDVWFDHEKNLSSMEKYSTVIGEECRKSGFIYLPDGPHVMDTVAFVGSIGWGDYSFRRPELEIPEEAYVSKQYGEAVWNDIHNIDWSYTDKEVTDLFNRKVEYDLLTLPESVNQVIFVSHHLPFRELTVYKDRLPWDFFSAFMGATSTGEILRRDGRVILSISGHSHVRNLIRINGITAMTVPIGYGRPEDGDMSVLAMNGVAEIDVEDGVVKLAGFVQGDICAGMPYAF